MVLLHLDNRTINDFYTFVKVQKHHCQRTKVNTQTVTKFLYKQVKKNTAKFVKTKNLPTFALANRYDQLPLNSARVGRQQRQEVDAVRYRFAF
jgi:hypothetical protein